METAERKQVASYDSFLTRKWVKSLVRKIIDESIHYDINNNFSKIVIKKDKNQEIKDCFNQALMQLGVVNTGYINNKNIDSYIYYLLRNGNIGFVYHDGKFHMKTKSNEHVVNNKNFNIELLFNGDSYLLGIYKLWINHAPQKEIKDRLYLNVTGDEHLNVEDEVSVDAIYATNTPIVNLINSRVIDIITVATKSNLKAPTSWLQKLLGKWIKTSFLVYDFLIILNDRQTIVDDVNHIENGYKEAFKEVIAEAKEKGVKFNEEDTEYNGI